MSPEHPSVSVWVQKLREGDKDLPVQKLWVSPFNSTFSPLILAVAPSRRSSR